MSNAVSLRFDLRQFEAGLKNLGERARKARDRALFRTGVEMLADYSNVAPKPPIDWGDLRGSGAVQVAGGSPIQGLINSGSGPQKGKKRGPGAGSPPGDSLREGTVRVSFNTAYAAHLHESPDWKPNEESEQREPGQIGYKWMARKNETNAGKYRDKAAAFLKDELGT